MSGEKKFEIREIRPTNASDYCLFDKNGDLSGPKIYDSLILCVGYQTNRAVAEVEVTKTEIRIHTDENDKEIVYKHQGKEYVQASCVFDLGKVLSKKNC